MGIHQRIVQLNHYVCRQLAMESPDDTNRSMNYISPQLLTASMVSIERCLITSLLKCAGSNYREVSQRHPYSRSEHPGPSALSTQHSCRTTAATQQVLLKAYYAPAAQSILCPCCSKHTMPLLLKAYYAPAAQSILCPCCSKHMNV